jgi:hypothetical protein
MKRILLIVLLVASAAALAGQGTAEASDAAIVIPFEKHWVGPGHYVGTASDGGTIEMQLSDSYVTGAVQHFTATLKLSVGGHSLTAILDGRFNNSTLGTVLNGVVVDGWLVGAQVHEEGQLVDFEPPTFVGTVQLMPGSAD